MKKETKTAFGKKIYLLGTRSEDGKKLWLEEPSWDCNWYWGFGYCETYTNNNNPEKAKDISSHQHFDGLFLKQNGNSFDVFKKYFTETPLTNDEIWLLLDYMATFYTLKETAEIMFRGCSHYTQNAFLDCVKNEERYTEINQKILPVLFDKITSLLGETK